MADKNKITGGLNWLPHQCANMGCIHISKFIFYFAFSKIIFSFVTLSFRTHFILIKLLFVTP